MPTMPLSDLKAILAAEKTDALAAMQASALSSDRTDAMDYYLGDMSKDMPTQDGRSKAVSSDVADTIEGLMPTLMEIFVGDDEVARFEPVAAEDIEASEQETDYVNHVFMQRNTGFLVLYQFIKDALLSKVGIVKVWWEEREQEERETYLDQPPDTFQLIAGNPDLEVVEHSEHDGLHDVTVACRRNCETARVEGVPPEEFGIARNARTIRDAGYCFHEVLRTEYKLIGDGYDADQVKNLTSYSGTENTEVQARDTVEENAASDGDRSLNKARRLIKVTEHYCRLDYDGDGKAALYRVTTGGEVGEILTRDGRPDIERVDVMPFAAMTPVIVTHRFFGRSIADLVMDIQRIKTAMLRALLDNTYLANNPRVEVAEEFASDSTLDDLLVSRPGGIVRTKRPGGMNWQQVPSIGAHIYPLLQYQDATREWRTGVTRQGQGIDADALQNQTATAANQFYNAAQARVKLIARIFAETGIRDMFLLLHATIRKHGTQPATIRLRNQWVTVDPRNWKTREDMAINVGLGTGGKAERIAQLTLLANMQKEAVMAGMSNLVKPEHLYNTAKEFTKLLELKNVDLFFSDPRNEQPPQPQPDPKLIEIQMKAEIEKLQAQADIETQRNKTQAEMALAERKFEFEREIKLLEHNLKIDEHRTKMISGAMKGSGGGESADGGGDAPAGNGIDGTAIVMEMVNAMRQMTGPKRARKMPDGSWVQEPLQ